MFVFCFLFFFLKIVSTDFLLENEKNILMIPFLAFVKALIIVNFSLLEVNK